MSLTEEFRIENLYESFTTIEVLGAMDGTMLGLGLGLGLGLAHPPPPNFFNFF